ncbi:hypothetical protein Tco_1521669, partial [Tanacetum coccineum]
MDAKRLMANYGVNVLLIKTVMDAKETNGEFVMLMCILIVPQQNTGFILDSDMEGKNEESYKFPIVVQ